MVGDRRRRRASPTRGAGGPGPTSANVRKHAGRPNPKRVTIGSIVVDCTRLEEMIRFWSEAVHYVPRGPVRPDGVMLIDPKGAGPNLNLSLSNEGPPTEYRLHLDLYVTDPPGELERLVGLGATVHHRPPPGHDFIEMADPDGNLFCLIDIDWPHRREYWGPDWEFGRRPPTRAGPAARRGRAQAEP